METRSKSGFIRDLIIKIFLILLFVFLITLIFPIPNLTPIYNRIFNDNVQTMKDAAENYFTKERMPQNEGDSSKLTLKQMLDKKLILPFTDKNGNECDLEKSYVKVTKKKTEYELLVNLKCGSETNYIIEPIGCYDFCPDNSCVKEVKTDETTGKVTIIKDNTNTTDDKYKLQYLYTRTITNTDWVLGNWTTNKQKETDTVKLVDTKLQYTGKKKVNSGTSIYKHIKYGYKDNWTTDTNWTEEIRPITDTYKLADTRTLYTGQKKITENKTEYKHVKYGYKDNWTTDTKWTEEVKKETDILKIAHTRTLYTGQKKITENKTQYKHVKYGYKDGWSETGYQSTKYKTNDKVVLLGTRYTVRKTVKKTIGTWSEWEKDTTWRTSKPADTSSKQWSDAYNKKSSTDKRLLYNSYESTTPLTSNGSRYYEFLYYDDVPCKTSCTSSTIRVYYYRVYEIVTNTEYQYMYRTYSTSESYSTDEKVVYDADEYVKNGYTIVKYEYNYKINNRQKYVVDTKWTDSKTSPSGYEYTGETRENKVTRYEKLNKWLTNKGALGDYTYNVITKKQYRYKHNNKEKYVVDTKWTDSKTSPSGYEYTGNSRTMTEIKYEKFDKWVTSKGALGDYTYSIITKKQYKYKYNNKERYVADTIWTESITSPRGYEYTGEHKVNTTSGYVDLGRWVDSQSELGEYTYDIETRRLYRYKVKTTQTKIESKWFDKNPGGDWVYANQSRKVKVN